MNEKLNLLGKQKSDIIKIPEWYMLHTIKTTVSENRVSPIGGFLPYLLLSFPEHPEKIPSVSSREGRRMMMKQNSKTELLTLETA